MCDRNIKIDGQRMVHKEPRNAIAIDRAHFSIFWFMQFELHSCLSAIGRCIHCNMKKVCPSAFYSVHQIRMDARDFAQNKTHMHRLSMGITMDFITHERRALHKFLFFFLFWILLCIKWMMLHQLRVFICLKCTNGGVLHADSLNRLVYLFVHLLVCPSTLFFFFVFFFSLCWVVCAVCSSFEKRRTCRQWWPNTLESWHEPPLVKIVKIK